MATEKPKAKKSSKKAKTAKKEDEAETTDVEETKPVEVKETVKEEPVTETAEEKPEETTLETSEEVVEEEKPEEKKERAQKYMITYDKESKQWVIKKTGAQRASKRCKTKKEAMEIAERLAANQELNLTVKKKDGKFQKRENAGR